MRTVDHSYTTNHFWKTLHFIEWYGKFTNIKKIQSSRNFADKKDPFSEVLNAQYTLHKNSIRASFDESHKTALDFTNLAFVCYLFYRRVINFQMTQSKPKFFVLTMCLFIRKTFSSVDVSESDRFSKSLFVWCCLE